MVALVTAPAVPELPLPLGTVLAERFVLERLLGQGGFGTVYAARDRWHGAEVAVKVLRHPDPASLGRIRREFRALGTILHPNIVELYELVRHDDRYGLVMELVRGVQLRRHLCGTEDGRATVATGSEAHVLPRVLGTARPLDRERLADALGQLVLGIDGLHAQGVLHRDLKPSNVLVEEGGRVVIVDFGLLSRRHADDDPWSARRVGTPGYMAPEQIEGRASTEATDWYAFGALLFELHAGRLPFEGTPAGVLEATRRHDAPRLSDFCPDAPPAVVALCAGLLAREPSARPGAAEVRALFPGGRLGGAVRTPAPVPSAPPPASELELFVGREEELAVLHGAWSLARSGRPAAVLVAGASGIGKSALVRHFARSLEEQALVVAHACYAREDLPYKAIEGVSDALARALAVDALRACVAPEELAALACVFPPLAALGARPWTRADADPVALRALAAVAAARVLTAVAAGRPLVFVVDDIHWSDRDGLVFLGLLLAALGRALFVGTVPDDGLAAPTVFAELGEDAVELRRLALAPLPRAASEELATALVGERVRGRRLALEAAGHPFLMRELARRVDGLAPVESVLPDRTIDAVVGERIERLAPGARRLLEVLAVAAGPVEETLAAAVAGCGAEGPSAVRQLLAQGLARTVGSARRELALAPYHDHVGRVAARALGSEARRALHAALALALEARPAVPVALLALEWALAGERARAAPHAEVAAEAAERALAFDRAAALHALALEHARSPAHRARLRARRADALAHAGRGRRAADEYLVAASSAAPELALDLRRRAAEQLLQTGHLDEGERVLCSVLGAVGLPQPARGAARIPRLLAARARVRAALAWPASQRADDGGAAAQQADVCWAVSTGLGFVDPVVASEYSSRFTEAALRAGDPARVVRALSSEAMVRVGGGERAWPKVAALLRQAEDLARRHGDPLTLGRAIGAHGVAAGLCQRFEQARRSCELAEQILRDRAGKAPWEVATVQHFALYAALELGELDFVCRRAPELYRDYRARDNRYAASGVATNYANLAWLVTEGPTRARALVHEAESFFPQDRFHLPRYDACIAHVHLDLHEGRPERALERVEELFRLLRASHLLRVQAVRVDALFLRARTELAMAAAARLGRPWLLARAWRSIRALAGTSSLLARPLGALLSAAALALAGRRTAAEARLRGAVAGLDGSGALLFAACARLKLGALVGGSEGAELRRAGLAQLSPGVLRAPDAFASLFLPGLDP